MRLYLVTTLGQLSVFSGLNLIRKANTPPLGSVGVSGERGPFGAELCISFLSQQSHSQL